MKMPHKLKEKGKSKDRRIWTKMEDEYLVEILEDLVRRGYNRDNGFKNGTHLEVEKKLEEKMPGCGIKASPHIESKMKTLKKHYTLVTDMLDRTGFGWNETLKCVEVDTDDQWESYLKVYLFIFIFFTLKYRIYISIYTYKHIYSSIFIKNLYFFHL